MSTEIFKCLRMNWLSGWYEWVTFTARSEAAARALVAPAFGYLPESLSPAREMYAN
jgi:hypothetical protein